MSTWLWLLPLGLLALWVWWRFLHIARPVVPPLDIAPDDILMMAAIDKARATLGDFRKLHSSPNKGCRLKVPFVTSSGETEHLWAAVRRLGEQDAEVLYLTPPVTHTGRLERIHTHKLSEISDWQVELPDGRYRGGFTMRVMFVRGREQWGTLPPELESEERRYRDEAQQADAADKAGIL